ncbi:MAG: VCBS repeat-containing protein, partial [Anaerolineales bacterium]|nr:VCBS repeat-containing protein [Anaerolineales bacterium]
GNSWMCNGQPCNASARPTDASWTTYTNYLYLNNNGTLSRDVSWVPSADHATTSVAWGDVNRDGYLDLAVGNNNAAAELFINNSGQLTNNPITLGSSKITTKVAWGDINGDGWLDLVVANHDVPNEVYINDGAGNLQPDLTFWNPTDLSTIDLVLGDIDNDGDLDLVTAPLNPSYEIKVYLNNQNQGFSNTADYTLNYGYESSALALGDMDGDDDLELAVVGFANAAAKVFENINGRLQTNAVWVSQQLDQMAKVKWGDVNGDGYLDLIVADHGAFSTSEPVINSIYLSQNGELSSVPNWTSANLSNSGNVAIGDVNNDGRMDVTFGNGRISQSVSGYNSPGNGWFSDYIEVYQGMISPQPSNNMSVKIMETGAADFYGRPEVLTGRYITMPFKILDVDGDKAIRIEAEYSPNGGGKWYPAIHRDSTTNIISGSFLSDGTTYEYYWDTFASGLFGQSDNVVFRLTAYPSYQSGPNRIGEAYHFASYATQTFPFRLRGTQVQVFSGTIATPAADAQVWRIPAGANTAQLMANSNGGQPFETDEQGYLSGRGEIGLGDQLIALVPTTPPAWLPANKVEVYLTNGVPSTQSLAGHSVAEPGVQQLVVSQDNKLVLFNLDVSLEWDARQDDIYMTSLEFHLRRASDLLFDWSNGQMALGHINLYHNREMWEQADIRILASNRYRPNATKGGLVSDITTDPSLPTITYGPGQLRMGATWNRTGQAAADLSEDWARTLVHELGHYLLFMDDNYFGFDENGNFINIDSCTGVMANPYRDSDEDGYDEFHSDTNWLTNCAQTASNVGTGRSDWATLATFYPLQKPANGIVAINGPNGNPFVVTFETKTTNASTTIEDQSFTLIGAAGGPYFAAASAQGFIARQGTHIINLGNATRDQLLTRGVQPNDRLCLQDLANGHFGCKDITADDNGELLINTNNSWRPDIAIRPVNSTTVQITIKTTNPASDMYAQIYPSDTAPEAELLLTAVSNTEFTGQFDLDNPTTSATVHVWGTDSAANKRFDTITDYELGGNPICFWVFTRGCNNGAPVLSADGRAVINGENLDFGEGEFYVLQTASALPELPAWGIPVGQPYRLTKSAGAPAFDGLVLQLTYLQREVPL